jgi:hypothetical protein
MHTKFDIYFKTFLQAIEKLSPSMKSKCDLLRIGELDGSFIEVIQEFINKEKEYLALSIRGPRRPPNTRLIFLLPILKILPPIQNSTDNTSHERVRTHSFDA